MTQAVLPLSDPPPVPDLMLSFRHRDALAQALAGLGRRVVAARRSQGLASRFHALGAHVLIVDARDAAIEALTAIEALAEDIARRGQGLIVLLGEAEAEMAPAFLAAGAHRVIGVPWRDWEMAAALQAADLSRIPEAAGGGALVGGWCVDMTTGHWAGEGTVVLPGGTRMSLPASARAALRQLGPAMRARAFAAIRQLMAGADHAAFAQPVDGGLLIHHCFIRAHIITAQVESIGVDDNAGAGPLDPVTGLRRIDALAHSLAVRPCGVRAIALVEVGMLARYNDSAGREAGDAMLAMIGRRLDRQLSDDFGTGAMVVRVEGARFAVLAPPDVSQQQLSLALRALVATLADGLAHGRDAGRTGMEPPLALRVAAGECAEGQDVAAVLRTLARRLATPRAVVHSLDVEAALDGEGLRVVFQPQYRFDDDGLAGAEALVRWQHSRLGEIGGGALFSAARAAALERPLSNAVWQRAMAAMAEWPALPDEFRLALNITAADLADPHMTGHLLGLAADHGIAPTQLTVEITESAVIDGIDDAVAALRRLRAAGLKVALDDFGSGYSGLSWLKRLPVDYIKIDSGFTRDSLGGPRDRAVLAGVLGLARSLHLDVVAEGVETAEQHRRLKQAGCRWYQGHLRSEALPSPQFAALLGTAG